MLKGIDGQMMHICLSFLLTCSSPGERSQMPMTTTTGNGMRRRSLKRMKKTIRTRCRPGGFLPVCIMVTLLAQVIAALPCRAAGACDEVNEGAFDVHEHVFAVTITGAPECTRLCLRAT